MNLPSGWARVTLGEVANSSLGKMLDRAKRTRGEPLPYLRNQNVRWQDFDLSDLSTMPFEDHELERYDVAPGDILICEGGEPGRSAIWRRPANEVKFQKALHRVRPSAALQGEYLVNRLMFDAATGALEKYFTGTTIKHFTGDSLRTYDFPLPPLAEQRRIVAHLDSLFTRSRQAKASLDRLPALLDQLRQSVLAAAFRGDLTKAWREAHPDVEPAEKLLERIRTERRRRWEEDLRAKGKDPKKAKYVEPAPVETEGLPELPEGWAWASLEAVTDPARVIRYGILMPGPNIENGIPYVKVRNMRGDVVDMESVLRTTQEIHNKFRGAELADGDLLVSIRGTWGRVAVVPSALAGGNVTQDTARIAPLSVHRDYLAWELRAPHSQHFWNGVAKGVAVRGVNIEDLRKTPVAVPSLAEQAEVARVVADLLKPKEDALTRVSRLAQTRLAALEQSLLAKAFRGELVPQDPNDEPASVLLERIRAERAEAGEAPRRGRRPKAGTVAAKRGR